jgi:AcrR family transcriptional regulator
MTKRAPATPKTRRTQKERREGTIRKLLDAATEAVIELGYAEASVQRIAERAELSQGAIFRHFATREALMVAVGEDVGEKLLARYRRKFRALPQAEANVQAAMRLVRDACRSRLNQAWYELTLASRTHPHLKKQFAPLARRYYKDIAKAAREVLPEFASALGDSFDVLVATVIAVFDGETIERFALEQPELEAKRFALLVATMQGIAAAATK